MKKEDIKQKNAERLKVKGQKKKYHENPNKKKLEQCQGRQILWRNTGRIKSHFIMMNRNQSTWKLPQFKFVCNNSIALTYINHN